MIIDSLRLTSVTSLPAPVNDGLVSVVYLTSPYNEFEPGFYFSNGVEWAAFGGATGTAVQTYEQTTTIQETLNLAQFDSAGVILSILITKNTGSSRQVAIKLTSEPTPLEIVTLENTYTSIAVPVPHSLYSLVLDPDLTITIKTL